MCADASVLCARMCVNVRICVRVCVETETHHHRARKRVRVSIVCSVVACPPDGPTDVEWSVSSVCQQLSSLVVRFCVRTMEPCVR